MVYRPHDHSFDWKGFTFFLKFLGECTLVGVGSYYGLLYAEFPNAPVPPMLAPLKSSHLALANISTSTAKRIINKLTIEDAIPHTGKLVAADLVSMKLLLFEDGRQLAEYPILSKGRTGSAWETPSGMYAVQTKEETHFSSIGRVYMPYSMQFYGNYFMHGWTYYPDGTPTSSTFSGGCIKLSTEDAKKVFEFVDIGTKVFVYDAKGGPPPQPLAVDALSVPSIHAEAYLVADIDTGDVYAEKNAQSVRPIASVTKLMTALVANETISFDKKVSVTEGSLFNPPDPSKIEKKTFLAEELVYPLLMQSSNGVADSLASYYGRSGFVTWMNTTARALGMSDTTYADASGASAGNLSTADDLFRLAMYLTNKKSFVLNVTHLPQKIITAEDGTTYKIANVNTPVQNEPFAGGKAGHTLAAKDTMLSVVSFNVGEEKRRVAVIVLGSENQIKDTSALAEWLTNTAPASAKGAGAACVGCTDGPEYRKIEI